MDDNAQLEEMTWPEARDRFADGAVPIVPLGTLEQHGLHLPLGSDAIVPHELAKRLADEANVIVMPPVYYGFVPATRDWPGGITISHDVVERTFREITDGLIHHGADRILLLTGHPEHEGIIKEVARKVADDEPDVELMTMGYWSSPILDVIQETAEHFGGHAHEPETSIMLALRPELVHMDRAVAEESTGRWGGEVVTDHEDLLYEPVENTLEHEHETTGTGGDPFGASAEKGEAMVDAWVDRMAGFLDDWTA